MILFSNIPDTEKDKEWFRLLVSIIERRAQCPNSEISPLLNVLSSDDGAHNWKTIKHLIEYCLNNAKNSQAIFSKVTTCIKIEAEDQDDRIDDMFAELSAIPCLYLIGFESLVHHKVDSVDFSAKLNGVSYGIEVKHIRGPSFKTQEKISLLTVQADLPLHKLTPDKLVSKLESAHDSKIDQLKKYVAQTSSSPILFLITKLEETDPFWLKDQPYKGKHPIQGFVDECSMPTILLSNAGLNLYVSSSLSHLLLPFDRNKYIELSTGKTPCDIAKALSLAEEKAKHLENTFKQTSGSSIF